MTGPTIARRYVADRDVVGMVSLQLELFPDMAIVATPADRKAGGTRLEQCSNCGLLVAAPDCGQYLRTDALGTCPRCTRRSWWRQTLPVGPFKPNETEARPTPPNQGHQR